MKDKNDLHGGHRKRMQERFLAKGMDGFALHEILEVLLYQVIPYKDTNETAHELLKRYGTLANVLNAPVDELVNFKNIGESAAVNLTMLPEFFRVYQRDLHTASFKLDSAKQVVGFVQPLLADSIVEEVYAVCTNAKKEYINKKLIRSGNHASVELSVREVVQFALASRANGVIIAHSHPGGTVEPSVADIRFTKLLHDALMALDITLMEHTIIAGDKHYSFFRGGEIAKFREAYETRLKFALGQEKAELEEE